MLNTTSMFITFHGNIEDSTRIFYESLARNEMYYQIRDIFLTFAKENEKHKKFILRVYREVITDAFEGGFPLTSLNEKNYMLDTELLENADLSAIVKKAIKLENMSRKFCEDAARSTRGLMADVPQAFEWVAKRKTRRIKILEEMR